VRECECVYGWVLCVCRRGGYVNVVMNEGLN